MHLPLERVQADFAAALIDATLAPALLPHLSRDTRTCDRVGLYRANLTAAWEKALGSAYPVVRALVGDEFFAALARAYGRACPSVSGDLNLFGAQLPGFVSTFAHTQSLPYLGDVAALEWAVHCAHCAADAESLSRAHIAALSPCQLLAARFVVQPACAWFDSRFPVASIWLAHQTQSGVALPDSLDRGEFALIVRPQWRVHVLLSSAGEIAALKQLRCGADMDCAIGAARREEPDFDFTKTLVRWLDHALLTDMLTADGGTSMRDGTACA